MREVAESHRGLFPEHADAYGANVRLAPSTLAMPGESAVTPTTPIS